MTTAAVPHQLQLIETFAELPGISPKTASRLAFFLLRGKSELALRLADALQGLVNNTRFCSTCYNVTKRIPADLRRPLRDHHPGGRHRGADGRLLSLGRTENYHGVYHVLHGALSPLEGIFAEDLKIAELEKRVREGEIREIILATNPTSEGDYTAAYLVQRLKPLGVRMTRLGRGLPVGGDLEYADAVTLSRALEARQEL